MDCILWIHAKVTGLSGEDIELTGITVSFGTLYMLAILYHTITKLCHLKDIQASELLMS